MSYNNYDKEFLNSLLRYDFDTEVDEDESDIDLYNTKNSMIEIMNVIITPEYLIGTVNEFWNSFKEEGLNPIQATNRILTEMANMLYFSAVNQIVVYKELTNLNRNIKYHDIGLKKNDKSNPILLTRRILNSFKVKGEIAQLELRLNMNVTPNEVKKESKLQQVINSLSNNEFEAIKSVFIELDGDRGRISFEKIVNDRIAITDLFGALNRLRHFIDYKEQENWVFISILDEYLLTEILKRSLSDELFYRY